MQFSRKYVKLGHLAGLPHGRPSMRLVSYSAYYISPSWLLVLHIIFHLRLNEYEFPAGSRAQFSMPF